MLRLYSLLVFVAASLASSSNFEPSKQASTALDGIWEQFKLKFSKVYSVDEEPLRRAQWERNAVALQRHNLAADMGAHDFTLGLNEYADWSQEEYQKHLTGYKAQEKPRERKNAVFMAPENMEDPLPKRVDWREKGFVTPVKNQGACGSCWAFSATGSLEGQHFRKSGKMVALSEQQLVDCSGNYGNNGCNGGLMDQAFDYIEENKGIDSEQSYPYTARDGDCKFKAINVVANDTGYVDIPAGDEKALMQAVATVGPVSVAIDAGHLTFQLYRGGVYWSWFCSSSRLDHGVLVVGYGTENGKDYWLVKNSWGESWGLNGYIKMARNMNNMCGIATAASYPLV